MRILREILIAEEGYIDSQLGQEHLYPYFAACGFNGGEKPLSKPKDN